jgi:hypothetical protein
MNACGMNSYSVLFCSLKMAKNADIAVASKKTEFFLTHPDKNCKKVRRIIIWTKY